MYANKKSEEKKKISPGFITKSITPLVTFYIGGKRKIQPTELPGFLNPRLLY